VRTMPAPWFMWTCVSLFSVATPRREADSPSSMDMVLSLRAIVCLEYGIAQHEKEARGVQPRREIYMATTPPISLDNLRFDRRLRTASSEGYYIIADKTRLGVIDLHFSPANVQCTLILEYELERTQLARLIDR
jgi:hypothetical protein